MLVANVPWDDRESVLQTVRASPAYGSSKTPWFDSVEIDSGQPRAWYGQLRLLFSITDLVRVQHKLAFVRWYEEHKGSDTLVQHGCIGLKWAELPGSAPGALWHQVIDLHNIIRRVYVVPDFKAGGSSGRFHVSAFKWDRQVPDKRGHLSIDSDDDGGADAPADM